MRPVPDRVVAVTVVAVAVLCYLNALANLFALDDLWVVLHSAITHDPSGLWLAFVHPYWPEYTQAGQYRPLAIVAFTLDWIIAPGKAWWYHLVNLLWHAGASLLVWRYLRTLLPAVGAAIGALFFALHPVHVEAVANIVGRAEIMMTVFVLCALLAHRRGSALAILWFALAILSKESGVVFVGLAVAADVMLSGAPRETLMARRWLYVGYLLVGIAYAGVLAWIFRHGHFVIVAPTWRNAPAWQRWLTVLRLVPEYVRLMLAPYRLAIDYTPNTITLVHSVTPLVVLGTVLLATIVACTVVAWRRAPVVAYGIVFFAVALSPVSNVLFPSGVVIAERTLYLPSVGVAILAGWVAVWALARRPAPVAAVLAAVALLFVVRVWTRTPVWHDDKTIAINALDEHPESYRAHATASAVFMNARMYPEAKREAAISRTLYPPDPIPYISGVDIDEMLHSPRDTMLALADSAVAKDSTFFPALLRSAEVRYEFGDYQRAMTQAWAAYQLSPDSVRAIRIVTLSAQRLNDYAMADRAFRRAIADHPDVAYLRKGYAAMLRSRR
jgi:protein O-mannosyl-transferase